MKMLKKAVLVALVISGQYLKADDLDAVRRYAKDIHGIYLDRRAISERSMADKLNSMAQSLYWLSAEIDNIRDFVAKSEYIEIAQQAIDESVAMVDWINSQERYTLNPARPTELEGAKRKIAKARFELTKMLANAR